jgi:hypothetical protein
MFGAPRTRSGASTPSARTIGGTAISGHALAVRQARAPEIAPFPGGTVDAWGVIFSRLTAWLDTALAQLTDHVWAVTASSIVLFVFGLAAAALLAVSMPEDYFADTSPPPAAGRGGATVSMIKHVAKNIVGLVVLASGIVMLVVPGPGLVFIVLGLSLIDFPGKRQLERRLVSNPHVLARINRMRARFGRPPLKIDS